MAYAIKLLLVIYIFTVFHTVLAFGEKESNSSNSEHETTSSYRTLELFSKCRMVTVHSGDYKLLPDGTLHVEKYNLTLNKTFFDLFNNSATICKPLAGFDLDNSVLFLFPHLASLLCLFTVLILIVLVNSVPLTILGTYTLFALYLLSSFALSIMGSLRGAPFLQNLVVNPLAAELYFPLFFYFWVCALAFDATANYQRKLRRKSASGMGEKKLKVINNNNDLFSELTKKYSLDLRVVIVCFFVRYTLLFGISLMLDLLFDPLFGQSMFCAGSRFVLMYTLDIVLAYIRTEFEAFRLKKNRDRIQAHLMSIIRTNFLFYVTVVSGWYLQEFLAIYDFEHLRYVVFYFEMLVMLILVLVLPYKEINLVCIKKFLMDYINEELQESSDESKKLDLMISSKI